MTDLNDLYYREQVSMMRADAAGSDHARALHQSSAEGYRRIIAHRRSMWVPGAAGAISAV